MVWNGSISILPFSIQFQTYPLDTISTVPSPYFFSSSKPQPIVLKPEEIPEDPNDIKETDSETIRLIKELLNTRIRPRVKADGGDILFHSFNDESGEVFVRVLTPLFVYVDDGCLQGLCQQQHYFEAGS